MSASSSSAAAQRPRERGATLVEYGLILALVVAALLGGLQAVQDSSEDEFDERAAAIGDPGDSGGPPSTSPPTTATPSTVTTTTTTTTTTPTSTTTTTLPPTMTATCPGAGVCSFSVANPPAGATYAWTSTPAGLISSTSASVSYDSPNNGPNYTVRVAIQPGSITLTRSVTCSGNGSNRTCTAS